MLNVLETLKNLQSLSEKLSQAMEVKRSIDELAQDVRALTVKLEDVQRKVKALQELVQTITWRNS